MRRTLFTLTLGSLLALGLPAASLAQDNPQTQEGGRHGGQGRMNPDRQLERMTRELGLSTDQQAQIRPLLVDRQQKMMAVFQNQSLSQDERRQQMRSIGEASRAGIKALLTDDQKQKFEQMRQHRGHGGPDDQGGPGQSQPEPQQ